MKRINMIKVSMLYLKQALALMYQWSKQLHLTSTMRKHSNLQEESIDQLHENIDQWQKAYDTLKEQYQHVEKVPTCNDGRPSHVSIQLYDKCCNALKAYMFQCKRLRTQKEQQLDRFCTAWEDLKWERDAFAKEIIRRDCCGEGVISKKFARKLRRKMLRNPNIMKN